MINHRRPSSRLINFRTLVCMHFCSSLVADSIVYYFRSSTSSRILINQDNDTYSYAFSEHAFESSLMFLRSPRISHLFCESFTDHYLLSSSTGRDVFHSIDEEIFSRPNLESCKDLISKMSVVSKS